MEEPEELETLTDFFIQSIRHVVTSAGHRERHGDIVKGRISTAVLDEDVKWNSRAAAFVRQVVCQTSFGRYHYHQQQHQQQHHPPRVLLKIGIMERPQGFDDSLLSERCLAIQMGGQSDLDALRLVTFTRCDQVLWASLDDLVPRVQDILLDCFAAQTHCDIVPVKSAQRLLSHGGSPRNPFVPKRKNNRPKDRQNRVNRRQAACLSPQQRLRQFLEKKETSQEEETFQEEETMVPRKRPNFTRRFRPQRDAGSPTNDAVHDPSTNWRNVEHRTTDDVESQSLTLTDGIVVESQQHDDETMSDKSRRNEDHPQEALVGKVFPLYSHSLVWKVLDAMGALYYVYLRMRRPS